MQEHNGTLVPRLLGAMVVGAVLVATIAVPTAMAAPKPTISSFSPTSGPVGTVVTIAGQNFSGVTSVTFRNTAASFTFDSDTQVHATVPAGAQTGPIRVSTPAGTGTSAQDFTVTGTPPTISSFSPTSGGPGTTVIVKGSDFTGATVVRFGGTGAVFTVNSDLKITTSVPAGATTGPIQVTTPSGTATSATNFVVSGGAAPTITSFSPTAGPVGTSVTILGSSFIGATDVRFSGVSAGFTINSDSKITATVPSGATTGRIKVITPAGTATSSTSFRVDGAAPTIASFSPTSGPVGTTVVIRGDHFSGVTTVTFNGTSATFTVVSDARIDAKVPTGATTGRIKVTSPAGTGTSAQNFLVSGAPTITSFTPTSGPVGTSVVIRGDNLTGATKVTFNELAATFTVNSDVKITAKVPPGATTGRIKVITPAGTATSSTNFRVSTALPEITSVSPRIGRVGASVTILGANFVNTTRVRFGSLGAGFSVVSPTQITATVPPGASTGAVRVTTSAGTTTGPRFTVFHARAVTLKLRGDLVAHGRLRARDGYGPCAQAATVLIQRWVRGHWLTIARVVSGQDGSYGAHLRGRAGEYRALVVKRTRASGDICGRAVSRSKAHGRRARFGAALEPLAVWRPIGAAVRR